MEVISSIHLKIYLFYVYTKILSEICKLLKNVFAFCEGRVTNKKLLQNITKNHQLWYC